MSTQSGTHNANPTLKTSTREMSNGQTTQPSYNDDSSSQNIPSHSTITILHASIAAISESQLRQIMVRLVEQSPSFQHAVAKELHVSDRATAIGTNDPQLTPRRRQRSKRRPGRRGNPVSDKQQWLCVNCGLCTEGDNDESFCVYHPGKLEEDIYEFLSHTPEGFPFQIRRMITMWSCCDEDVCSPGCATAFAHTHVKEGVLRMESAQAFDEASHSVISGDRPVEPIRN